MAGSVVVVGSANVDLVVDVPRHPRGGETILGENLRRTPGGKGANQAVAAARGGGADVTFVGAVGRDDDGELLLASLRQAGVRTDPVSLSELATGTALIAVTADGENTIIVAPGANSEVTIEDGTAGRLGEADVILAQLEIPLETVSSAARARREGATFVLNAAPSRPLPADVLEEVDVLVVNEPEAREVAGREGSLDELAAALNELVPAVVVTLGADGAVVARRRADRTHVPAPKVRAVDTTGAGDAFCGVLAAALAAGTDLADAVHRACLAGALTATRSGAQTAVPSAEELDGYHRAHPNEVAESVEKPTDSAT